MTAPYVGSIGLFAGVFEMKGWLYCAGQTFQTANFPELYKAIGNRYGGDATQETFALPDLQEQEKALNGVRYQIAVEENEMAPLLILGSIFLWGMDTPPEGCAFCDGTLLRIPENTPLYTILMVRFGGNGTSTFALPDLREAEKNLQGVRYVIAVEGVYPARY